MKIAGRAITEYDLKLLKVFKSVVENGGFAAAEDELGITRSTISVHMNNLETRMRLTLCHRGRGGFVLTPDGQTVYQACLPLFAALGDFSNAVSQLSDDISGPLVIFHADVLDEARHRLLAATINTLMKQAPGLSITLDGDRIENIEQALLKDKAHVGIFPGYRKMAGLAYTDTLNEPIYLCCLRSHPLAQLDDNTITDEDIAGYPAVVPGVEISQEGREQLKKLTPGAYAYQFDSRKALIASGRYIGYLPGSYVQNEVQNDEFRLICPARYQYNFAQSLVHKQVPAEPKKVALFTQVLNTHIQHSDTWSATLK
ncbi:LysR family transcriptional regulator [Alteromonas ponticola]|uniref:LysR family transcriptional regulator n=1 Tax=Alteromonas ponticola TaxID=2720613 RepID=A0ABX1R1C7_9ALTE|nr:LysR family transcriptional regulator [Alteromonas ponticola]NMH60269.1 LysR family transcriptional regulator [Alteromonas ponticola]